MYLDRIPLCLENLVDISIFIPTGDIKILKGLLKLLKSPLTTTLKTFLKDLTLSPVINLEVFILNRLENSI